MNYLKYVKHVLLASLISFALVSCSDDDDKNSGPAGGTPDPSSDLGNITLAVTGDVEAEHSGMADFFQMDVGNTRIWELNMHDYSPQTFDLTLMLTSTPDKISRPEPGSYTIGFSGTDPYVFHGMYSYIEDSDYANSREYSTMWSETNGTLIIETSTEQTITGTFEFTANHYDDDTQEKSDPITVSGSFSANKRVF